MIDGVKVKTLKPIPDERGRLMEMLRSDEEIFKKFGQVYMTTAFPQVTKAWHYHKIQTDSFICVFGKMKVALYDSRPDSKTFKEVNEFILSMEEPRLVQIPPLVYHGFKCIADKESIIINVPTEVYNYKNPDEYRLDAFKNDIPYDWSK